MAEQILCLNAGSSSLKFALYALGPGDRLDLACKGEVEGIGTTPRFVMADAAGRELARREWPADAAPGHEDFLAEIIDWVEKSRGENRIAAAEHRIVHGGTAFGAPVRIDERVLAELERLVPLAPLHQPHNLAPIRARVCSGAAWLGIDLDPAANEAGGPRNTRRGSWVSAWVVPTDEDLMIARHARDVLCNSSAMRR